MAEFDVANYEQEGQATIVPTVTGISPASGSLAGGTEVTISGSGLKALDEMVKVMIGSAYCDIVSVSATEIKCNTPAAAADSTESVKVYVSGFNVSKHSH